MASRSSIATVDRCAAPRGLASGTAVQSVKADVIRRLRDSIEQIERPAPLLRSGAPGCAVDASYVAPRELAHQGCSLRWGLGCPALDALLPGGLEVAATHEVKAVAATGGAAGKRADVRPGASAGDWMTAFGFAARLGVRLTALHAARSASAGGGVGKPWMVWCWSRAMAGEFGGLSAAGLVRLGLDPARLIIVETPRAADALNALEESLRASSLALAFGVFDEVDLTAGRRLSLAAGKGRTPCLLMTHPGSAPAGATATRWRVARAPSAPHPFDARAPGHTRFLLNIERCRTRPESAAHAPLLVEWCHETRRFDLAAVVADPAARPRRTDSGSLTAAVRTG